MILITNADLNQVILYNTTTTIFQKIKTRLYSFNKHHPLLQTILGIELY